MKEKILQEEYEEVKQLVEYVLAAQSKQEAEKYIPKLQYCAYGLSGNVNLIFRELVLCVKDASGRVANKEQLVYLANRKLYEMERYVVEE